MADTTNFQAAAYTSGGTQRDAVALPGAVFDGTVNMPVMHQAVKAYLANQRQGNAATKIRKYVTGGNQKPWKQKGTGRARQGSTRAPHWVGGGTVFGPIPRSYAQYVPKQVRALARKSAFNARARENAIFVIDAFNYDVPKTSRLQALVARLGLDGRKVLILTDGVKSNVHLSGRNLPTVHVMPYSDVSTYHILWSDAVLIEAGAIGHELAPVAEQEPTERPKAAKKSARPAKAAKTAAERDEETEAKSARKSAAKKSAAKAPAAKKKTAGRKSAAKSAKKAPTAKKSAAKKAPAQRAPAKKKEK
ncbi:MAG TPA: 50S ribosomal protein L4 [Gemmatimonadaceae bacterium]|nr:50S ribosomal protein L4 [Gemmatimonadaceae bacterium]